MTDKTTDKRKLILKTALKLFSTQGARTTSMQDIADMCGISKGSLYLHFKSKEELEAEIYNYCFKTIEDQMLLVEHEPGLSPRERLYRQMLVLLRQIVEFREYFRMQFMDYSGKGKLPVEHERIRRSKLNFYVMLNDKITAIYGPAIAPYSGDLLVVINGMISAFIQLMFLFSIPPFTLEKAAAHLLELIDSVAGFYMNRTAEPLIPASKLEEWLQKGMSELPAMPRHPLMVIQELRQQLAGLKTETLSLADTYETLSILEEEFLHPEPRKAILTGMLANLASLADQGDEQVLSSYLELKELVYSALGHPDIP